MRVRHLALLLALGLLPATASSDEQEGGFVPMFNGKDLTGWVNVNCAPETFFVKDNMIITTGKPTGYLRTERQYENFIAEFDWMHIPPAPGVVGNSGFFVWADPIPAVGTGYTRGIEVQVQEPQDQGAAQHQSETAGHRGRCPGTQGPLHGSGPARLEGRGAGQGALAAEGLRAPLRRQGRVEGERLAHRQDLRRRRVH